MPFTRIVVTGSFPGSGDGRPASGAVDFTLSAEVVNGASVVPPRTQTAYLDSTGHLTADLAPGIPLYANDDPGTLPADSNYLVVERIDGAPVRQYRVHLSHTLPGQTVDLSALEPVTG